MSAGEETPYFRILMGAIRDRSEGLRLVIRNTVVADGQ